MKIQQILNESGNQFYIVDQALKLWKNKGFKPTNNYAGSSRISQMEYEPINLDDGDEIHHLAGGIFFVKENGDVFKGRCTKPADKNPFEKSYGGYADPNAAALKDLLNDGKIGRLGVGEQIKAKYYPAKNE